MALASGIDSQCCQMVISIARFGQNWRYLTPLVILNWGEFVPSIYGKFLAIFITLIIQVKSGEFEPHGPGNTVTIESRLMNIWCPFPGTWEFHLISLMALIRKGSFLISGVSSGRPGNKMWCVLPRSLL